MSARNLAALIESYLEADSGGDASNGTSSPPAITDSDTRQQLRELMKTTNQLKDDTASLRKDMTSLQNNLQMSMILPMLLNQKLTVVEDADHAGNSKIPFASAPGNVMTGDTITFKSGDALSALLPVLLLSGSGDGGGGGFGGNSSNFLFLALALSGKI